MIVVASRFRLKAVRAIPPFFVAFSTTLRYLERSPGFLRGRQLTENLFTHWILTSWTDIDSMVAFRNSDVQVRNMKRCDEWCRVASFVHWEWPRSERMPTWLEAHGRLTREGKHVQNPDAPGGLHFPVPSGFLLERRLLPARPAQAHKEARG